MRRHTLRENVVDTPVAVRPSWMCRSDHAYSIPCHEAICERRWSVGVSRFGHELVGLGLGLCC